MSLDDCRTAEAFVAAAWDEHASHPLTVLEKLSRGLDLVAKPADLPGLAALVVHVAGEHLGRWPDGLTLLERLERSPHFDGTASDGKAVLRSKAVLLLCAGEHDLSESAARAALTGGGVPEASDRIRVLAVTAAALAGQRRTEQATAFFEEALALAAYGPGKQDPAARALAVTSNNLACDLEERADLTLPETDLMLRAARAARRFWEVAGGWTEVERAEYRLAMSSLRAGLVPAALEHAVLCLAVVTANGSDPGELVFAHEALAKARHALGDLPGALAARDAARSALASVTDEGFRSFAGGELSKLDALLGG